MATNSNIPGWAPRAPMIVMSEHKLSFFAKANSVRAGIRGSYGSLAGLGDDSLNFAEGAADTKAAGGLIFGERSGSPSDVKAGGSTQSVADFAANLSRTVQDFVSGAVRGGGAGSFVREGDKRPPMPWWQIALALGGVVGVGVIVWKAVKK